MDSSFALSELKRLARYFSKILSGSTWWFFENLLSQSQDVPKQGGFMARVEKSQNFVQNVKDFQLAQKIRRFVAKSLQNKGVMAKGGGLWLRIPLICKSLTSWIRISP